MNFYNVGSRIRLQANFYSDVAKTTPADPSAVTFSIREPDGTITAYTYGVDSELVRESLGVFYVFWVVSQSGKHWYGFAGTGAVVEADDEPFFGNRLRNS